METENGVAGVNGNKPINLFDNCVILSLTLHFLGDSAQGDLGEIETSADKSELTLNKKLLNCKEHKEANTAKNNIANAVKRKCLGGESLTWKDSNGKSFQVGKGLQSVCKRGMYILPNGLIQQVEEILAELVPVFKSKVETLISVYNDRKEEARKRLKAQFDEKDYSTPEQIRRKCYVEWKYLSVGVPESLKQIQDLFTRERQKTEQQWYDATQEILSMQRVMMKGLVDHMLDSLKPTPEGKKKKFYDTTVGKLKEFLEDFAPKNITNDQELAVLVNRARGILGGRTADDFRKDEMTRERVLERLGALKVDLDKSVEEAPVRGICLED